MENINYKSLELHKILEMLSGKCTVPKSKELALAIRPQTDIFEVKKDINETARALELTIRFGTPGFYKVNDISAIAKRAEQGGILSIKELMEVRRVLMQTDVLVKWFDQLEDKDNEISYLFESLFPENSLLRRLNDAIIDENSLSDDASPELRSIRRKISRSQISIRESLDKMIKSSEGKKYMQESIVTIRDGRFVIPVKREFKGNVSGLVHDISSTGSTLFIEPMCVVEANNDIRILHGQEQDEIHRILTDFSTECGQLKEQLISSYNAICELDVCFSKANLAADMKAMQPEISDDGIIILNKARHPLIDEKKVVPVNFSIGEDYNTLVITGPNTGGKTVVLKTVGLLTLMTMCGLLIPASDGSRISVYKKVLVDIGDQQSIENDLSTFSSHISTIKHILDEADSDSLVLLDELGSGTDPVEGAALAVSIIDRIKLFGATLVTTTHYQEIKMYAIDTDGVQNASCQFDVETLKPTYNLVIGFPGKSNAFEISRSLGIDEDIIKYASSLISSENKKFENILDDLEKTRSELEKNNAAADNYKREAEALKQELENEREKMAKEKEDILERARLEAQDIVRRVQRESQQLVDELDELRKEKEKENFTQRAIDARHKQKSTMNKLYLEANPVIEESNDGYVLPRALVKGDRVLVWDTKRNGIIISPPDSKGYCFVQIGVMKSKVEVGKLRLVEKQQPVKTKSKNKQGAVSTKGVESRMTRKISTELDIRGYASDDGIYAVDSFIDDAVMSGVGVVTIIHGKGTGVLKNAIRSHLKHHPSVKSSRKGLYGEGEDGVTVVELK